MFQSAVAHELFSDVVVVFAVVVAYAFQSAVAHELFSDRDIAQAAYWAVWVSKRCRA